MSRGKELVKNTAIVAVGKVCTKFISFFLLPLYTALLSTEDYGIVDLYSTYIMLLMPLVIFQIEDALFRFMIDVRESQEEQRKVISTVTCFCVFQCMVFSFIYFGIGFFVQFPYYWYFWLIMIVTVFSSAFLQMTRGLGDNVSYAFGSFLAAAIIILLNIVFIVFLDMKAEGLFLASILSNSIAVLYLAVKVKVYKHVRIRYFDRKLLKEMLRYSLPLVPNNLSWWVIGASDKSVVSYFMGVGQNGILSVSQKFSSTYTTFYSIFNLTWTEHATMHRKDEDNEAYYSQVVETSFRILASVCLGIIAVVALAFPWLINDQFDASYAQIPIYMVSSFLYSVIGMYSVVYIAEKKTGKIARTSMAAAAINLLVNVLLINHIGLYAASISSVVAYGVLLVARLIDIRKIIRIRINPSVVWSVVFFLVVDFITYYIRNTWISLLNLLIIVVYVICVNRKTLQDFLMILKTKKKSGENQT